MADLILDISAEFLKRLVKADKEIEKISNKSGVARQKLTDMFSDSKNVNEFISKLKLVEKEY